MEDGGRRRTRADVEEDEPRVVDNCISHWGLQDMLALRQSATRMHPGVRVVGEGQSGRSTESTLHTTSLSV